MKELVSLACGIGITLAAVPTTAAQGSRCFRNVSLKSTYSVRLDRTGDQVSGAFVVEPDEGDRQEYRFTGTLHARRLAVSFPADKLPAILTRERPLVWRLLPTKDGDALQVRIYGQNYQTKKFSSYNIMLTPCGSDPVAK